MKEKEFEFDGQKYLIKRPSSKVSQEASKKYSIEFIKCVKDGVMTKEQTKNFLIEHGVWTKEDDLKEKELSKKLANLETELYRGSPKRKKVTLEEGRAKSLEMRKLRSDYIELIARRQAYEANTAESLADNARFDFLVAECTYNVDGTKVYNSYEDYISKSSEELAYTAATTLAQMVYGLNDDFAEKLPENRFLSMFNLVDEEMRLVNEDGHLVDEEYRLIDENGFYVDKDGNRVDRDGHKLTKDGLFDFEAVYVDKNGKPVVPKTKEIVEEEVVEEPTTSIG
jgi:hypothetical protein